MGTKDTDHPPVPSPSSEGYRYVLQINTEKEIPQRRSYLSTGRYLVGSLDNADVALPIDGVSRKHAVIEVLPDGGVILADCGSRNGTFLGGRRIVKAAFSGAAALAFGPVAAQLSPVGEASRHLGIEAGPRLAAAGETTTALPQRDLSTAEDSLLTRLLRELRLVLSETAGDGSASQVAIELVRRWSLLLNAQRMEFVRTFGQGGESIVASAGNDPSEKRQSNLDVDASSGWTLRLWLERPRGLERLRPLFEVALSHLAALEKTTPPITPLRPGRNGDGELPAPGSLNSEMRTLYRRVGKVAAGEIPVLILGESGVGKEVLARWLHQRSGRASAPFVAINCTAFPKDLLEAELFGIERGVATGVDARAGLLEQANGGIVLLDEIGDMALETQAKLLRVLENKTLLRVGGRQPRQVDVRFVAATNQPLDELVSAGRFRSDLFHRLAAFVLRIPALRERREDIPLLAAHFFARECGRAGCLSPGITRAALGELVTFSWPGNVRQLENEISKAVLLLETGEPLDLAHLSSEISRNADGGGEALPLTLESALAHAQRQAFQVALAAAAGEAKRAIALLGISRATFYRKLKELGLDSGVITPAED